MKTTRFPLPMCVCIAALALLFAAPSESKTIHETFPVGPGGTLHVDTDIGSIEVRTSGVNSVEVEIESSGSRADMLNVDFSNWGDDVRIRGDFPRSHSWFSWFGGGNPKVRFRITVPRRYDVNLNTAGGSISVSDLQGRVEAKTSGGSLSLGNIDGTVRGHTSGGSIRLEGCSGRADVNTSGGSINIGDVDGEVNAHTSGGSIHIGQVRANVNAKTSGGSIHLEEVMGAVNASTSGGSVNAYISEQPMADCRLTTSGGGVNVTLASDIAVDISARASSKVYCDFDLSDERVTNTSLSGRLNGGGPELFLKTSGGSVKINRR